VWRAKRWANMILFDGPHPRALCAPLFWTRDHELGTNDRPWPPRSYKKDQLSRDFARIRTLVFWGNDQRQLADLRWSGSIEMVAGEAARCP